MSLFFVAFFTILTSLAFARPTSAAGLAANTGQNTPMSQLQSTVFNQPQQQPIVNNNPVAKAITPAANKTKDPNLSGSGITLNDQASQGPFYPGDSIFTLVNLNSGADGGDFVNGQAKITLSQKYFSKVDISQISLGSALRDAPTITSDNDGNWVVTLDFNTLQSGNNFSVPITMSLASGYITNGAKYPIKVTFTDDNGFKYTPADFLVTAQTDPMTFGFPNDGSSLDYTNWDKDDQLKADQNKTISAPYYPENQYYNDHKMEPGQYNFTLKLPTSKDIKVSDYGEWTYDQSANTLTRTLTINPSVSEPSLDNFTMTFLKGYKAGTSEDMTLTVTGPNSFSQTYDASAYIDKEDAPDFKVGKDKTIRFNSPNGDHSLNVDHDTVSSKVPVISTLQPVDMNDPSSSTNAHGTVGTNNASNEGLNDPKKLDKDMNYAELNSVTDKVGYRNGSSDGSNFDYQMKTLAFIDSGLSPAVKKGLEDNTVYVDGKDIGHVTFEKPLDLNDKVYKQIQIKFAKPVIFDNTFDAEAFNIQITGHMTDAEINDFKNSTVANDTTRYYYNEIDSDMTTTEPISQDKSDYDDVVLNKDVPHVIETPYIYSNSLSLSGQDTVNNNPQVNGGHDLTASMSLSVDDNEDMHTIPKDAQVVFIVPDGVSYDNSDASDVSGLTNVKTETNYANSGKTAIIGDITDADSYGQSDYSYHNYSVPLKVDENYLVVGDYNVQSYFVLKNNNYKKGDSKTDNDSIVNPQNTESSDAPDSYGLYLNTNNQKNIISNASVFHFNPIRHLITTEKVSVLNPETNEYGKFVDNSGQAAYSGDKVRYQMQLLNAGQKNYDYLDVIDVLPYPGDVLLANEKRNSEMNVDFANNMKITRTDEKGNSVDGKYKILYSTAKPSTDLSANYQGSFSEKAPSDLRKVTMIRIQSTTKDPLNVGDTLTITYDAKIPDLKDVKKAVNNYTVKTSASDSVVNVQSTEAIVNSQQPFSNVTVQFWGRQKSSDPYTQFGTPDVKNDQQIGKPFTTSAADYPVSKYPFLKGYTPADNKQHGLAKVSRDATKNVVKLYYNAVNTSVTAKFQDTNGKQLHKDVVIPGWDTETYDLTKNDDVLNAQKEITNKSYQLVKTDGQTKGTLATDKPVVVTYTYKKVVNPTPNPTPTPQPKPDNNNTQASIPDWAAVKGSAVYSLKKIYLYKHNNFSKKDRLAGYTKKPRVYRPMFVVTGYARSKSGHLRYKVRDVNHLTKNRHKKGYITANWNYVRPVYYQSKHQTLTVINPRGVNAYKKANLTKKVRNYKQGTVLHVTKFVHHNLTTRYVLSNGNYITGNRKLVKMGKQKMPRYVKVKKNLNRHKTVNLGKRNKHIKKGTKLRIKNYDFSHANSVTKTGALRYHVAGGYITGNSKYVKIIK